MVAGLSGGSAGVPASAAASGPWALDTTFGDNGTARISVRPAPNESWDTPGDVAAQSDNKILVVGSTGPGPVR